MEEGEEDLYGELAEGAMELYESDVPDLFKAADEGGEQREQFGATEDAGDCARCEGRGVVVVCDDQVCLAAGVCFHDGGTAACPSCGGAQ